MTDGLHTDHRRETFHAMAGSHPVYGGEARAHAEITVTLNIMSSTVRRYGAITTSVDTKNAINLALMVGAQGIEPWTSPV
jgi:hypothetical protein